jgi:tripartite ATP-independent transporter DctM subunit
MVIIILGIIYTGVATPTEAAGVGGFCAFLIAIGYKKMTWKIFNQCIEETLLISAMIMWIVLGAKCFVHVYTTSGASAFLFQAISGLGWNIWIVILLMMLILFVLGMFLDPIGIMLITLPIFAPVIESYGMSLIWFGVLYTINLEMGYISPPFGLNLFYMKSILPKRITMNDVYMASLPFLGLEWIGLLLVMFVPIIALWLPGRM